jgi:hypothetical protein
LLAHLPPSVQILVVTVMTKRLGLLLLPAAVIAAMAFWKPPEPQFKNRGLSDWLNQYQMNALGEYDAARSAEAEAALRAIGTNALPYLLKWIRYEPYRWQIQTPPQLPQQAARQLHSLTLHSKFARAVIASDVIALLGTNAASAVPELGKLARDGTQPSTAARAIKNLAQLGTTGLPELFAVYDDTTPRNRKVIIIYAANYSLTLAGADACVPLFLHAMKDQDPEVRSYATNIFASIRFWTNAPAR